MAAKNKSRQPTTNGSQSASTDDSPLRLFGEVKDKINGLYLRLDQCVKKASDFYSTEQVDPEILANVDTSRLQRLSKSIEIIRGVLSRNQMKVAFFGRTSAGKSTVINAILHEKVLPMDYGHTTGCFLQVQGNKEEDAFLEGPDEKQQPIQSVSHIANALNTECLEYSTLVRIYWPISKCPLLKYDVALVDSPGVDFKENVDDWIDKHCHDADVFVLVTNAESSLGESEKGFFRKVSEKLSKPNIFILNNRWDLIAEDSECIDQIRAQHTRNAVDFLSDQLRISTRDEAEKRIFFVSAREALRSRSPISRNAGHTSKRDGFDDRYEEFVKFERCFEELLSKSAVRTKFKQHTDKGKETIEELSTILLTTQDLVSRVSESKRHDSDLYEIKDQKIHQLFYSNESGLRNEMLAIKKRAQLILDKELDKEINFLSRVVKDFDLRFPSNRDELCSYKDKLYQHVEDSLRENFRTRIKTVVEKHVNPFNEVVCRISQLLSKERQQRVEQVVVSQSYVRDDIFDPSIYRQFYTGFQEDLEFRFSLGMVTIIRKFQSVFSGNRHRNEGTANGQGSLPMETDLLSVMERFMMNPPQSPTTVGSLAVGGILVRTVGWKVIVVTTVVYGALYAYEYLTWTNAAKERTFKAQYVRYAKKGLQDCMPTIIQHIANSVEQKMTTSFTKVKEEVDKEDSEIRASLSLLRNSLVALEKCDKFTRELLGENDILMNELVNFASSFLI